MFGCANRLHTCVCASILQGMLYVEVCSRETLCNLEVDKLVWGGGHVGREETGDFSFQGEGPPTLTLALKQI